jgi:hypothetical protein
MRLLLAIHFSQPALHLVVMGEKQIGSLGIAFDCLFGESARFIVSDV